MTDIIALWTHPRSISTAFERVMMERGDLNILHEPFSYLYYVHKDAATIEQQYVDPSHPTDYPGIRAHIKAAAGHQGVFFKDMCAHGYEHLKNDDPFLQKLTNTFLIRDPAKAIASYYAMNPDVTSQEIGLAQLCGIFEKVRQFEDPPIVVDADDLEDNPEGVINAYCQAVGIDFIPESLTWEAGHQSEWDIWEDWHTDAAQSTGIRKNVETFEVTVENSDRLKAFYEDQLPYYEKMYQARLSPELVS
jgi:hypothetical protein